MRKLTVFGCVVLLALAFSPAQSQELDPSLDPGGWRDTEWGMSPANLQAMFDYQLRSGESNGRTTLHTKVVVGGYALEAVLHCGPSGLEQVDLVSESLMDEYLGANYQAFELLVAELSKKYGSPLPFDQEDLPFDRPWRDDTKAHDARSWRTPSTLVALVYEFDFSLGQALTRVRYTPSKTPAHDAL